MSEPITWKGRQAFYIVGTGHNDDTIMITGDRHEIEDCLSLVLPTLCITYADQKFANGVGGTQKDYPDSVVYGSQFFDPPVVISGDANIRKFTWIRGAEQVTIGPRDVIVEWRGWHTLIIPKLRIKHKEKVKAVISVPEVAITVSQPFMAKVMQYSDGRHIGGVQLVKRHPNWKPESHPDEYDLWIRVIDGHTRRAIPEAKVSLYTWRESTSPDKGEFVLESHWYTNHMGIVEASPLPCSRKKLIIIDSMPWLTQTWRFRPLQGQKVRRTLKLWQNKTEKIAYQWKKDDTIDSVASLAGTHSKVILDMNRRIDVGAQIKTRQIIEIPCYEAVYRVEVQGHTRTNK